MISRCGSQVRVATIGVPGGGSISQPIGLDFGAVLAMGDALGVDLALLADVLPAVETALLTAEPLSPDDQEATDD